jgi:hypothetical protein
LLGLWALARESHCYAAPHMDFWKTSILKKYVIPNIVKKIKSIFKGKHSLLNTLS